MKTKINIFEFFIKKIFNKNIFMTKINDILMEKNVVKELSWRPQKVRGELSNG